MSVYRKELKRFCMHCGKETESSNRKMVKLAKYPKYFYVCLECGNPYDYKNYQELVMYLNRKNKNGRKTVKRGLNSGEKSMKQKEKEIKRAGLCVGTYKLYLQTNHWKDLRSKKLEKNPICQFCKKEKATQVHHLRYCDGNGKSILYKEKSSDLLSVCEDCHKKIHNIS